MNKALNFQRNKQEKRIHAQYWALHLEHH
jgi:hypothetical protein